jgi:hypothetical protein
MNAAATAGGAEPPENSNHEHRITALETRLDTVLPTLATKADVASLRGDMQAGFARLEGLMETISERTLKEMYKSTNQLLRWMIGLFVVMFVAFLSAYAGLTQTLLGHGGRAAVTLVPPTGIE